MVPLESSQNNTNLFLLSKDDRNQFSSSEDNSSLLSLSKDNNSLFLSSEDNSNLFLLRQVGANLSRSTVHLDHLPLGAACSCTHHTHPGTLRPLLPHTKDNNGEEESSNGCILSKHGVKSW